MVVFFWGEVVGSAMFVLFSPVFGQLLQHIPSLHGRKSICFVQRSWDKEELVLAVTWLRGNA